MSGYFFSKGLAEPQQSLRLLVIKLLEKKLERE
jgi:hypothetical protein